MTAISPKYTGGCLCGAVRYAFDVEPIDADICHCRMCQKATGSFFAPFAGVPLPELKWTKGEPKVYRSSAVAERGFCPDCGTPLTFRYLDKPRIGVSIGSLDDPAAIKPTAQCSIESRVPWFDELAGLPGTRTEDDMPQELIDKIEASRHSSQQ
jgi:hypothetical protein